MSGLENMVALVTGAASGMGRAHCVRFAEEGADVLALDIDSASAGLLETAELVREQGQRCALGFADVRDHDGLKSAISIGVADLGRLDVVVANAGVYVAGTPAWEISQDDWSLALDVNLTGVWHTVTAALPHIGGAGGSIVVVNSVNGLRATPNSAAYNSSKHALLGLTRTLANELGPRGIRVNSVHPGAVGTPMILNEATFRRLRPDLEQPTVDDAAQALRTRTLLPVAWVEPVDVSNAVVFLASAQSRYITGAQLVVDAGLTQKVS